MALPFPRAPPPDIIPDEEDLEFQITDWYVPEADRAVDHYRREAGYPKDESGSEPPEYSMVMFGVTADGHSVAATVTGFMPYLFVKVPESWGTKAKSKAKEYEQFLRYEKVKKTYMNRSTKKREEYMATVVPYKLREHLEYVKVVKRKEFYGFTNGADFPFLKIRVKSLALFNVLKRYFMEPAQKAAGFLPYESNIDPFLRFIHERDLKPCGWVRLAAGTYDIIDAGCDDEDEGEGDGFGGAHKTGDTRAAINVSVASDQVQSLEYNKIAPLLVASFDIECTSSHGDFPVARKDYRKLATDLIATANHALEHDAGTGMRVSDEHRITAENVTHWIKDCFFRDTFISSDIAINRVYPLYDDIDVEKQVMPVLKKHAAAIVKLIIAASNSKSKCDTSTGGDGDDGDEDKTKDKDKAKDKKSGFGIGSGSGDEDGPLQDLTNFLTKYLPKLKGDAIIQIGTTVNRFGSDEIVYKHIASLNSCDKIEGADVDVYESEKDMILGWKEMLQRLDPDILTGYNIFGFDMKYVWERAQELYCVDEFAHGLGRANKRQTFLDKKELSSAALGDNTMYFWDMDGVIMIDMLKVMQRDHKLDSFKLDHVAGVFLGDKKNDISPRDIFEKFLGSSADRCEIARYCIQDCALVNRLLHKLKVLENNVGMGNVCSVPLSYLFMRGQGIKIFSLVSKECRAKQYLIPVVRSGYGEIKDDSWMDKQIEDESGYEGAVVLDPQEGMYLEDPITVLDYSSLYPSSMIARNLSHDCYVQDPESPYAKLSAEETGITYQTVSYDVYEGKGDAKKSVGQKSCTFAQLPNGQKGIIPSILMKLLQQRKNTRKKIEYERLELSDGRIAVGLVTDKGDGTLEIVNVDQAEVGVGSGPGSIFGGHKAVIDASLVVSRREEYNKFEQAVLDALQLAFKVTANSLYGQIGSRTSPIYLKDIAACTTATGREMIMTAKNFVETNYDAQVIYGDSVTGDTPLLVRYNNGVVAVKTIETLSNDWIGYEQFKPWDADRKEKEQTGFDGEVWANGQWAKVARVIRHKVNKKIYRVNTFQGCVDVTEDHSLVGLNGEKLKPGDCVVGTTEVLHTYPTEFTEVPMVLPRYFKTSANTTACRATDENDLFECTKCDQVLGAKHYYFNTNGTRQTQCKLCIKRRACERLGKEFNGSVNKKVIYYDIPSRTLTKEEAWVMGFFFGDGSCGNYKDIKKQSWAINNQNLDYLHRAREYLAVVEPIEVVTFKILDTLASSGVYKLVPSGSIAYMVEKYRALFYDKDQYKCVPDIIINSPKEVRESFLQGYLTADGCKPSMKKGRVIFCCKGKIGSMGLYYIAKSIGHTKLRVRIADYKPDIYWICSSVDKNYFEANHNKIMKINELPPVSEGTYVYDIETSQGMFNGGIGMVTLFNTDSIFIKFNNKDAQGNILKGREALPVAIKMGQHVEKAIKTIMPPPQCLAYEKTLWPFIIFSKKRYVGNLYEDDANKKPKQKSMGIVLKRRDNAPIVKKVYGGIIDILMSSKGDGDLARSVEFLREQLRAMVEGQVDLQDLIISKTLRASYKDPSKIAHKVLARRMGERDAGNKPQANDRIPFVFIKTAGETQPTLQGDRIEHPDYIRENNLTPDYYHYITNQLLKPICQIYALCVNKLPGYRYAPSYWEQIDTELSSNKLYVLEGKRKDRIQALKAKEVESLIFEEFLSQLKPIVERKVGAGSRTKVHALDRDRDRDLNLANPDPNVQCEKYTLTINCRRPTAPKTPKNCYDVSCTLTLTHTHTPIVSSSTEESTMWTNTITCHSKKNVSLTHGTEHAFKHIYENFPDVRMPGAKLHVVTDKAFAKVWKSAFNTMESKLEEYAKSVREGNLGRIEELQETITMNNLIKFHDTIPYTLGIPETLCV